MSDFVIENCILRKYVGAGGAVVIPKGVVVIEEDAFRDCINLTSVTIPNSVFSIENNAFRECKNLTSITIPSSVMLFGEYALGGCSNLTSIFMPDNLAYCDIDGVVFTKDKQMLIAYPAGRNSNHYSVPDSVTSIGRGAFSGCESLTSITIPDSVTSIGEMAFIGCCNLTNIILPNGITSIEEHTFAYCSNLTNISIPSSVTKIGNGAFSNCNSLRHIAIPGNVASIEDFVFYCCDSLTEITIPASLSYCDIDGVVFTKDKTMLITYPAGRTSGFYSIPECVKSIGARAFIECHNLTDVVMPNSVTSIGEEAFSCCDSLSSVIISDNLTSVGEEAFEYCKLLTSIALPESVTNIGNWAFCNCSGLENIMIPSGVARIGYGTFSGCKGLTEIILPESVTTIERNAFYGCINLTNITIPRRVTNIGNSAFSSCDSLSSIIIPDSVTNIGNFAFSLCSSLTSIAIPSSVTRIDKYAFHGLKNLTGIYNYSKVPLGKDNLDELSLKEGFLPRENFSALTPNGKRNVATVYLSNQQGYSTDESEQIEKYIKSQNSRLLTLYIENGWDEQVQRLLNSGMVSASALIKAINTHAGPPKIIACLLEYQNAHVDVAKEREKELRKMERDLTRTEPTATELRKLWRTKRLEDGTLLITAYKGKQKETVIPSKIGRSFVSTIGEHAFWYCASLDSIIISEGVTSIKDFAFSGLVQISITIPDSVVSIGSRAFAHSKRLIIRAHIGSYAETYTIRNNIQFEAVQ